MDYEQLIAKRDLLRRNLAAGEGIAFTNGPFAQYEQDRMDRQRDLQERLSQVERQIRQLQEAL